MNIEIRTGDLTRVAVDAIVNAANESLLGGGGVDGAIHRAAGPELVAFCRRLGGCPPGEARVTPGFALPANWIIHTVGPIWRGGTTGEPQMLARCYRNCFDLAERHAFRGIAFPAISTGVYGYPLESATRIALAEATRARRRDTNIERVIFVCFDEAAAGVYQRLSNEQPGPTQVTDR